jgi:urocanate hydratase
LRKTEPTEYVKRALASIAIHVRAMLKLKEMGAVVFEYGNNIRQQAKLGGVTNAFDFPGFVPAYIRPMFCEGRGPFRWIALSGDKNDIYRTDEVILEEFPGNSQLANWIKLAGKKVP